MKYTTADGITFGESIYLNSLYMAAGEAARAVLEEELTHAIYIITYALNDLSDDIIRLKTKEYFNHTALAFDKKLEECYTFSMTTNGISKLPFKHRPTGTDYMVYEFRMTENEYHKLRNNITKISRTNRYKYNWTALINACFKTKFKVDEKAYYCTEFVYNMLKASGSGIHKVDVEILSAEKFKSFVKDQRRIRFLYRRKIKKSLGGPIEDLKLSLGLPVN